VRFPLPCFNFLLACFLVPSVTTLTLAAAAAAASGADAGLAAVRDEESADKFRYMAWERLSESVVFFL